MGELDPSSAASGERRDSRTESIARIVSECSDRLAAGEELRVDDVISRHPELSPELSTILHALVEIGPAARADLSPTKLGDCRILREVSRGPMSVVYEAFQDSTERRVAVKVLQGHLLKDRRAVERFRREARLASSLDHPGICPVYDAGVESGIPYIVMRFVEGETLATRIGNAGGSSLRPFRGRTDSFIEQLFGGAAGQEEAGPGEDGAALPSPAEVHRVLDLIERVACALHIAHEKKLVHRDIKPGNIMVAAGGEPVLLDFGIARATEGDAAAPGGHLVTELLGTPPYMAPELLENPARIPDRRVDVYALGVTLYECLTLRLPFSAPTRDGLYRSILSSAPIDPKRLNRAISRDLAVVLQTAMERDPDRRYQTAMDFAEDLRRVRESRPIRARPVGPLPRLSRWARRNPGLAITTASVFLALSIGLATALFLLQRIEQAQQELQANLLAQEASQLVAENPAEALRKAAIALMLHPSRTTRNQLLKALQAVCEELTLELHTDEVTRVAYSPDGRWLATASLDGKVCIVEVSSGELHSRFQAHDHGVLAIGFSPDATRLVTSSSDGVVKIWDGLEGKPFVTLDRHESGFRSAAFSRDGRSLVTVAWNDVAWIWDASTGSPRCGPLRGASGEMLSTAFSPDGSRLVTAASNCQARIWDAVSGELLRELSGHSRDVISAMFSPDGTLVLTASWDGTARLWNPLSGEALHVLGNVGMSLTAADFSPDGGRIVTPSTDGTARIWDAKTGQELICLIGHRGVVRGAGFDPRGAWVYTIGDDHTARIWNAATGEPVSTLKGHTAPVLAAAFSPDGEHLATASRDGTARIWRVLPGKYLPILRGHKYEVERGAFTPDGRLMVTVSMEGVRVWDTASGALLRTLDVPEDLIFSGELSADGRCFLAVSGNEARVWRLDGAREPARFRSGPTRFEEGSINHDGTKVLTIAGTSEAMLWDVETGEGIALPHHGTVRHAAFQPGGDRVITSSDDRTSRVWSLARLSQPLELPGHEFPVSSAALSADGLLAATGARDGKARVWSLASEASPVLRKVLAHPGAVVLTIAFSPDATRLVTTSSDEKARLWDSRTGALLDASAHRSSGWPPVFDSAGKRLIAGHGEYAAVILDAGTGQTLAQIDHGGARILWAGFSPDGRIALTCGHDNVARLWNERGEEIVTLEGHTGRVVRASFSPDGQWVLTLSGDKTARLWPVELLSIARKRLPRELRRKEREDFVTKVRPSAPASSGRAGAQK